VTWADFGTANFESTAHKYSSNSREIPVTKINRNIRICSCVNLDIMCAAYLNSKFTTGSEKILKTNSVRGMSGRGGAIQPRTEYKRKGSTMVLLIDILVFKYCPTLCIIDANSVSRVLKAKKKWCSADSRSLTIPESNPVVKYLERLPFSPHLSNVLMTLTGIWTMFSVSGGGKSDRESAPNGVKRDLDNIR
jgi:hypothetical protein